MTFWPELGPGLWARGHWCGHWSICGQNALSRSLVLGKGKGNRTSCATGVPEKEVYLPVVGSPQWLSSPTCSKSWQSFSSKLFPSTSISKYVALSSQACRLPLLHPHSPPQIFWKGNESRGGTSRALPSCALGVECCCTCPFWLREVSSCPQRSVGRDFESSDASTFLFRPCAQKPGPVCL